MKQLEASIKGTHHGKIATGSLSIDFPGRHAILQEKGGEVYLLCDHASLSDRLYQLRQKQDQLDHHRVRFRREIPCHHEDVPTEAITLPLRGPLRVLAASRPFIDLSSRTEPVRQRYLFKAGSRCFAVSSRYERTRDGGVDRELRAGYERWCYLAMLRLLDKPQNPLLAS